MRKFRKTISLILAVSLWQFFVPVLNVALELPCCEEQDDSTGGRQCCQPEFPARMVCCVGDSEHATEDSAPAQATSAKFPQTHFNLATFSQLFDVSLDFTSLYFAQKIRLDQDFYSFNPHLASNEHYKLLATFLI